MPNKNAWDAFRYGNDYTNFKNGCLNNTQDYGIIQFTDGDINNKLGQGDSEFIEIYRNDANRTPCVVIEYVSKPVDQGDNMTYTSKTRYLYRDSDFFEQFGSLKALTPFTITASYLRSDILNGSQNLNKMYDFSKDFDIRNEQYRTLKKLLLSDPFSLVTSEPDTADVKNQKYQSRVVSEYDRAVFRIITSRHYINLLACDSEFFNPFKHSIKEIIDKTERVDFIPLLYCQKVLINRLVDHHAKIQESWDKANIERLWALRGIKRPNCK